MSLKVLSNGTVTSPKGFKASGLFCGIKVKSKRPDLALVVSDVPAVSAATFTTNRVKAWPVLFSMASIKKSSRHRAIITNSGNANCVSGPRGRRAVKETVHSLARTAGFREKEILVCSTGLIGLRLPAFKITQAMPELVRTLSAKGGHRAARAILTTDTRAKEVGVSFEIDGQEVRMGAIAKGVGMVHPNMATMLNFITTDCAISRPLLFRALRSVVAETYNMMSIDNDLSTNDTVFILANGLAGNRPIVKADERYKAFEAALRFVAQQTARMLVKDAEGATKLCEMIVAGARTREEGEKAARTIANSMLFKTMLAGADPNWGRIVAALGASGIRFRFERITISFDDIKLISLGRYLVRNRPEVRRVMKKSEFTLRIELNEGKHDVRYYTCDLTKGYVHINASYSS